jgi:hypothetical protein
MGAFFQPSEEPGVKRAKRSGATLIPGSSDGTLCAAIAEQMSGVARSLRRKTLSLSPPCGWVHFKLPKWVKSKLALTNLTRPCEHRSGWVSPHSEGTGRGPDPLGPRTCPAVPSTSPPIAKSPSDFSHPSGSHRDAWHRWEGMAKDFARRPSSIRSPGCHGRSTESRALRHQGATSLWWRNQRHAQRGMGSHNV